MPGQHALELDEATRAGGEVTDDQQRPLVADEVERPRIWGPLVIRMTLGGRRSRDEILQISAVERAKASIPVLAAGICHELLRQFSGSAALDIRQGVIDGAWPQFELTKAEGAMGELIDLAQRREAAQRKTRRREPVRAQLFFDLACPFSYLATERVERAFSHVTWTRDVVGDAAAPLPRPTTPRGRARARRRRAARRRAAAAAGVARALPAARCRPRCAPRPTRPSRGAGATFVLAAGRLAFCGGFDLDDPEILAEAAAAAGIPLEDCFHAAGDSRRDGVGGGGRAASCWRQAPTGYRCCGWGARSSGASSASAPPRRRCARRPRRSRAGVLSRAYGLTSPARICAFIASTVSGRSASSSTGASDAHA